MLIGWISQPISLISTQTSWIPQPSWFHVYMNKLNFTLPSWDECLQPTGFMTNFKVTHFCLMTGTAEA